MELSFWKFSLYCIYARISIFEPLLSLCFGCLWGPLRWWWAKISLFISLSVMDRHGRIFGIELNRENHRKKQWSCLDHLHIKVIFHLISKFVFSFIFGGIFLLLMFGDKSDEYISKGQMRALFGCFCVVCFLGNVVFAFLEPRASSIKNDKFKLRDYAMELSKMWAEWHKIFRKVLGAFMDCRLTLASTFIWIFWNGTIVL